MTGLLSPLSPAARLRLMIAYLIAMWGSFGWLIFIPGIGGLVRAIPGAALFVLFSAMIAPVVWAVWMVIVFAFDRSRALLCLPGGLLVISPPTLMGVVFALISVGAPR